MSEAERIARELTKAQRRRLMWGGDCARDTLRTLLRLGLLHRRDIGPGLYVYDTTPLGEMIAGSLRSPENDHG